MGYTRVSHLVGALVGGAAVGVLLAELARALFGVPLLQPLALGVLPLLLAIGVLAEGVRVRRLREGRSTTLTPVGAARVAMFAKASSLAGAALTGFYGALSLTLLATPTSPLVREQLLACGGGALGFLVLTVAGAVVERWCRIDPPEDDDDPGPGRSDLTPA